MRLVYVSYLQPNYSRSSVHFEFLSKNNTFDFEVDFKKFPSGIFRKIWPLIQLYITYRKGKCVFVVMSPASSLVAYLRILGFRRIIFDGGWPLSDSAEIRESSILKKYYVWLIDYISIHLSSIYICESNEQLDFVQNKFHVHKEKLRTIYTGFSDSELEEKNEPGINLLNELGSKKYVLFRGKPNVEAGLSTIVEAAELLEEKISFVIASPGFKLEYPRKNIILIDVFLSWYEISGLYRDAFAVIGQMSDLNRVSRTIPHKFYEAAYFGKAYVTAFSVPIRNLLGNDVFEVQGGNPTALAEKISFLIDQPQIKTQAESAMNEAFKNRFKSEVLANQILEIARGLSNSS